MTALTSMLSPATREVVVLGCGENDDLDLEYVAANCADLYLVDVDARAIDVGVTRQLGRDSTVVHRLAVDISGKVVEPGAPLAHLSERADLVISSCVLSQLVDQEEHDPETSAHVRRTHVDNMLSLLRAGGRGALFTDVTSSLTTPELMDSTRVVDEAFLMQIAKSGNVFAGLNPYSVFEEIARRQDVEGVSGLGPWMWPQSADRNYLVVGVQFARTSEVN